MSTIDNRLTVTDFLKVRDHIASVLGQNSTTQKPTRVAQAERLMRDGFIDSQAVLDALAPQVEPETEEEGS